MELNKKYNLTTLFELEQKAMDDGPDDLIQDDEPIKIVGYANTVDKDRGGDVIPESAWKDYNALANYKKNPILLAYHDHKKPIGVCDALEIDGTGLKITGTITKAAGDVYHLIKAGVLKAFSVGFMVKDADYDSVTDIFVIKALELLEVSVVSVPMNQNSLFSVSKGFETEQDYLEFKKSFKPPEESTEEIAKGQETTVETEEEKKETIDMDKEQLEKLVADAANAAASAAVVKGIEMGQSGAERLLADAEARVKAAEAAGANGLKAVDDLRAELAEKAAEITALQTSKMKFEEKAAGDKISYAEKEAAVLMSKATGKPLEKTSLFQGLVQKFGVHIPSATWELEVSTNMQEEIRRALIIDPIFNKNISMSNPVMRIPVNPEATYANWVLEGGFKAATSSGTAQDHVLGEINLTAYKLATKEFLGTEEEDDSIIPLLPIVRDAVIRRSAKAWDKALLRGAGAGGDPIKGIITSAIAGETTEVQVANKATVANMITMRRKLGTRGLMTNELVYVVSNEVYYDLLEDTTFQTVDKVGNRATLLTGQIGSIANVPVILSGEFEAKAATKFGAVIVNQGNFLVGRYKGLRVESDYSVENQQRLIVASQRLGFQQVSTVEGNGVSVFKWTA